MKHQLSREIFEKYSNINSIRIRPVGAVLFHADRRSDRLYEAKNSSSQFCERASKQIGPIGLRNKHTVIFWCTNKSLLPDICKNNDWFDGSQPSPACPHEQYKHKYESGALMEWHWHYPKKTLFHCHFAVQISHGLVRDQNWSSTVRGRWLTTSAIAQILKDELKVKNYVTKASNPT
jgi:hypothetical protein